MGNLRILFLAGVILVATVSHAAQSPVTVSVDTETAFSTIPPDFAGLSFEVSTLLPNENGVRYFRPDNQPLINLFHTLGIKNLRIGGNSSDRDAKELPTTADIDSLFAFAKAAGVKVIYCLRLHNGDPQADAVTAKYIMAHYAPLVDSFSIGQEPSAYPVDKKDTRTQTERMGAGNEHYKYSTYRDEWRKFADAIISAVPDVKFCGPGVHNNGAWAQDFMSDFGRSNRVTLITEHLYPGGAGGKVPTPEIGRDRMLGTNFVHSYERLYNGFVPMAISNNLPYRLEEVNNYFNGGATNVSNTFASALWGLDFMYWWAAHGAAGLNFHTGDRVAAGYELRPSKYTAFFSTTNGYTIRPLGYGIKAFNLGARGQFVSTKISNPDNLNLNVYSVLNRDQRQIWITIINKGNGDKAHDAAISISVSQGTAPSWSGQVIFLKAPGNDIAATNGVTLGGAQIQSDGTWNGNWSPLDSSTTNANMSPLDSSKFTVPPASVAIVRLSANYW